MPEGKSCVVGICQKTSTFFFKKRILPKTVWGILQKDPFVEAESHPVCSSVGDNGCK